MNIFPFTHGLKTQEGTFKMTINIKINTSKKSFPSFMFYFIYHYYSVYMQNSSVNVTFSAVHDETHKN